jgi:ribosome biogenesis GTPase
MALDNLNGLDNLTGTVLAAQANFYQVQLDRHIPEVGGRNILCTMRAILKKVGTKVMVGDRVGIADMDRTQERGAIETVFQRTSELDRPPVANADQVMLIFALADPPLEPLILSKFLVKAESTGLDVKICLNKVDLVEEVMIAQWRDRLQSWGYSPIFISVYNGLGIDTLKIALQDKITVFAGHSGVGKSSLTNCLIPDLNLRVAAVSGKLNRGRHTTRHVELFELPQGGFIADTPGFNQPDLDGHPLQLSKYFPEIRQRLNGGSCQFNDCLHRQEPNCCVNSSHWERYTHYLEFLSEAIDRQEKLNQQRNADAPFKQKQRSGKSQSEPRLNPKKYRQVSRRTSNQQDINSADGHDEY